jgi:competence protein ComEC
MIPKWTPIIFVRFVFFFCLGILFHIHLDFEIPYVGSALLFLWLSYVVFALFASKKWFRKSNTIIGLNALLLLFLFGYYLTDWRTESNSPQHLLHIADTIEYYEATIVSEVQEKTNSRKAELQVSRIRIDSNWQIVEGKIIAYFSKKDSSYQPKYGDKLIVKGSPQLLQPPANPYEFDYKRYLEFHQIHHQHFLRKPNYEFIRYEPNSEIYALSLKIRHQADSIFRANIASDQEYAIATALVLGVKDGLDNSIKTAYSSAGAMHVLAVSGLHVGIIYQIVAWIFLFGKRRKPKKNWLFLVATISILWIYAFITGLSPSVLRAVTMFSVVVLAKVIARQSNIYNTLAVSAFILLLWNPYLLMQVGFQLSYVAVIGIVYIQPKLAQLWDVENRIGKFFWQMTCVSVAAQIATFPIGLLYFHQFPTYFWLSNFVVIPAASVILQLGLLLLVFCWLDFVASAIGWCLKWFILGLNWLVFKIQELPGSLIQGVDISVFETWLIYGCIFSILLLFAFRKVRFVAYIFGLTITLLFLQYREILAHSKQKMLLVYKTNKLSNLCLINGGETFVVGDSALIHDSDKMQFHLLHHFWAKNVEKQNLIDWKSENSKLQKHEVKGNYFFVWEGKKILYYQQAVNGLEIEVDYLIIGKNAVKNWKIISTIKVNQIILDASNSFYTNRDLMKSIPDGLRVYSVLESGAWVDEFGE